MSICARCTKLGAEKPRVAVCAECRELSRVGLTSEQCAKSLEVLRKHRHELVRGLSKSANHAELRAEGSLVPFLKASLTVTAVDNAIRLLERELKETAS